LIVENPFGNITFLHLILKLKPGEWYRPPGPLVCVSQSDNIFAIFNYMYNEVLIITTKLVYDLHPHYAVKFDKSLLTAR